MLKPEIFWIAQAHPYQLAQMPRPRADEWLAEELLASEVAWDVPKEWGGFNLFRNPFAGIVPAHFCQANLAKLLS